MKQVWSVLYLVKLQKDPHQVSQRVPKAPGTCAAESQISFSYGPGQDRFFCQAVACV